MSRTDPAITQLKSLTPAQQDLLAAAREEWVQISGATGPADRPAAEQGVRQAYRAAGLRPPQIVWLGSPLAGRIAVEMLGNPAVSDRLPDAYWSAVRTRLWGQLRGATSILWSQPSFWSQPPVGWGGSPPAWAEPVSQTTGGAFYSVGERWGQSRGVLWEQLPVWSGQSPTGIEVDRFRVETGTGRPDCSFVRLQWRGTKKRMTLGSRAWNQLHEMRASVRLPRRGLTGWLTSMTDEIVLQAYPEEDWPNPEDRLPSRAWGDAGDVAKLACAVTERRLTGIPISPRADAVARVTRSAGWWWPFEHLTILTERPTVLDLDAQYRLHSAIGPAVAYPDGLSVWAWHGVVVPREVIQEPERLTVRQIRQEPNQEVRRVMLERYGPDRYLRDAGAERVSQDDTGTLWRADLGEVEPLVMVEVRNSTPEPDGSHRTYWLRVPPEVRTAREAVAWTFGFGADRYWPVVET